MNTKPLLTVFAAFAAFVFTSCSSDENLIEEQAITEDLLQSYTLKRDKSGAYSLNYNLNSNAVSEVAGSSTGKNNSKEIYLYSSDGVNAKSFSENLSINNNKLQVGFIDTQSGKQPKITVIDDNIVLAKDDNSTGDFLKEYSVAKNNDGSYSLDFKVNDGVGVDFFYNSDNDVYEVHLKDGEGSNSTVFSQVYAKEEGASLKIDFVNFENNSSSRNTSKEYAPRKPKIIMD